MSPKSPHDGDGGAANQTSSGPKSKEEGNHANATVAPMHVAQNETDLAEGSEESRGRFGMIDGEQGKGAACQSANDHPKGNQ